MMQKYPPPTTPIEWHPELKAWLIWQYKDVVEILKHPAFLATSASIKELGTVSPVGKPHLNFRRKIINRMQGEIQWIRVKITQIALDFCQNIPQNPFDLQQKIILPFCQALALELTGIPSNDPQSTSLFKQAQAVFEMTAGSPEQKEAGQKATTALSSYFQQLILAKKKAPQQDVTSIFAQTNAHEAALISPIIQLFVGLATSLPLLLGNVLFVLLNEPQQAQFFLENPNRSLNELLRYAGPAQFVYRLVIIDEVKIGEHIFQKGDQIALFLAHANRDSSVFDQAQKLDLERKKVAHLSLGKGHHSCLGTPIIRAACSILSQAILNHPSSLNIQADQVKWGGSRAIWGITALGVVPKSS